MNQPISIKEPKAWEFYLLVIPVILLCLLGALITGSIGSSDDFTLDKNIIIICGGIVLGIICHKFPSIHIYLLRFSPWLLSIIIIPLSYLVIACFVSKYHLADTSTWLFRPKEINGSVRWLNFGGISIQVGEFAKIAICLFIAYICQKNNEYKKEFLQGFIYPLIPCTIIAGLILLSNSKSMTFVCMMVVFVTLFIHGVRNRYIYLMIIFTGMIFTWIIANDTNKVNRIYNWWNSITTSQFDYGTQAGQSIAIFSYDPQQLDLTRIDLLDRVFLAEKHNDFIFALVGHQLGIFSLLVVFAYLCFFFGCMIVMKEATTIGGKILAFSLGFSVILVAFINLFVVTGLIPVTGVTAPFFKCRRFKFNGFLIICMFIN